MQSDQLLVHRTTRRYQRGIDDHRPRYRLGISGVDGCRGQGHSGRMEVRVLGGLTLDDGGIPLAPRDRAVMAALTVRRGGSLSIDALAAAVWGDDRPASWSKVIPGCIMRLRRLIAPAEIETTPLGYRLTPEHIDVDAERFEMLVTRGAQQLELGEPERAEHAFSQAL